MVREVVVNNLSHHRLSAIGPPAFRTIALLLLWLFLHQTAAAANPDVKEAAVKYVRGFVWHKDSIVTGDFTCKGRKERAILGTNSNDIVIAVFLNGTGNRPEVLHFSATVWNSSVVKLAVEDLNFNPVEETGDALPGFIRSKTCSGLNLSDDEVDSAHIYWNRESHRFTYWRR